MIVLYVDHSGNVDDVEDHFVLGGVAVHEADIDAMRRRIEGLVRRNLDVHLRELELHAQRIRKGGGAWRGVPRPIKQSLLSGLGRTLGNFEPPQEHAYALFAVVRTPGALPRVDPIERSFEELLLRFNALLRREWAAGRDQFGLVVVDEAKYESMLQPIVHKWRVQGTRAGRLSRVVDVPLFVDSRATRLIQAADFVAHATYRYYHAADDALFQVLRPRFDQSSGVIHGLVHLVRTHRSCPCPACASRRAPHP